MSAIVYYLLSQDKNMLIWVLEIVISTTDWQNSLYCNGVGSINFYVVL